MLSFRHERRLPPPVAGVDEVGRGPWAGPVVAAAVILDEQKLPKALLAQLGDSKKLSEATRNRIFGLLKQGEGRYAWSGLGAASAREVDAVNVLQASRLAMRRALAKLRVEPASVLVDGVTAFDLGGLIAVENRRSLIRGDGESPSIAAASIIAKVTRDRVMTKLAGLYPNFGWQRNKGYGTRAHRRAIARYAPCPHHRFSFKPIAEWQPLAPAAS